LKSWFSPEKLEPQAKRGIQYETYKESPHFSKPNRSSTAEDEIESPFASKRHPLARNASDFYRTQTVIDRRIHVMGLGNVGRFIAHSLRGAPNPPPVTLIFHRWDQLNEWNASAKTLQVVTDGNAEKREGFDAELAFLHHRFHGKEIQHESSSSGDPFPGGESGSPSPGSASISEGESTEPINSLILTTKTPAVLQALSAVKHRLHKESVILFLQNGMGTVEEVNKEIFPDPETRPHYMLGINSHGLRVTGNVPFTTVHAGFGTIALGILPNERNRRSAPYTPTSKFSAKSREPVTPVRPAIPDLDTPAAEATHFRWTPNHRYLLRTLLRAPVLCATAFSPPDLLQLQLEKLAVNCIINPLTVMLDARNGAILYNYALTRSMRLLLSEVSLVIRSLPELQYIPNVQQRFDPGRLETMVVGVANKTKDNISSMLSDVRAGRQTEIDYINGWIVKKGEEQGVRCLMNYMMVNLVKGKTNMIQLELGEGVPFVGAEAGEGGYIKSWMLYEAVCCRYLRCMCIMISKFLAHAL
jgi:2-dehydropantoate 2-reductase